MHFPEPVCSTNGAPYRTRMRQSQREIRLDFGEKLCTRLHRAPSVRHSSLPSTAWKGEREKGRFSQAKQRLQLQAIPNL